MLINYFKIAIRSLIKNPSYSFINIGGLAIGIASSILILLWVADEYSYDRFHKNYHSIYKLYQSQQWAQGIGTGTSMPYPLRETLLNKTNEVKYLVMTNWGEGNTLQVDEKSLTKFGLSATEDFFNMFSYDMIKGDPASALKDPNSIVITVSTAKALFGDSEPLNQLVQVDNGQELKVTGVIKDLPAQSFFSFDYVLPFAYYKATQGWVRNSVNNWDNNSFQMYVQLQPNATQASVTNSIKDIIKDSNPKAPTAQLFLHPMSKWRLYSKFENGKNTGGMIEYVQLFTIIAIFVMIIACINFMNLATARSENRAREVGIRKSVGSRRKQLIFQFLGESLAITFISFLLAIVLVEITLPFYNTLVNKTIVINYSNPMLWLIGLAIIFVTGVIAGSYPAFYLSSFKPVKVLKGKVNVGKGASTPRKVLVTLQFGFSIFLIIGTLTIYQQIMHVKDRDMGYDRENLMQIWTNNELERNFQTVRDALVNTGAVKSVCKSNSPITSIFSSNEVKWEGMNTEERVSFSTIATEYDYIKTMGVKMVEGRDFSRDFPSDSMSVIINQAAADFMGMKDPIGQKIIYNKDPHEIIGVTANVVMDSPYQPVEPLVMIFDPSWSSTITVRLNPTENLQASIDQVEQVFKKLNPAYPFAFRFADSDFQAKFSSINLVSKLSFIFAALAIAITCFGLLGLAAFTAEQRTKEIGIRKVLGATVSSIVILITSDFSKLIFVAFLIASPIGWWVLTNFLERYPYRVGISGWILLAAGGISLILALLIVSTQALRAAISNPTDSLRSE
ncbi:ABC transporter permease [Chryseotalea sanaruensis]|uniref:ABC transporter permease n=1 Tax=Chryseotalea sanaruensis TaxID=2482724 RepID=A0A401U9V4_9BACT|nr:ABC transporter permease [Chryseotalea sanaruensis]GCC51667.1 ABC transporter permease [Chryseotalea sanaruensis]